MNLTRGLVLAAALLATRGAQAQGETVLIEQRVLLEEQLTPAAAKRRALEEAMAEAVRRIAGVRVQSSAVSTTTEDHTGTEGRYRSVVQLDAAGRATDARIVDESWETTRAPGIGEQVYYRATFAITVERDQGDPDPTFAVEVSLPKSDYLARSTDVRQNDELVASVQATLASRVYAFSIVDDSVHALVPNEFLSPVDAAPGARFELPDATWRARGLRFRVTLPPVGAPREELLAVVAVRGTGTVTPVNRMSLLEFQRWLVRIPARDRTTGFAPYTVRRTPGLR
ncbi:MAG: hypothetical protein H7066_19830 [Cytophagaceae bacterium]|nr:hypothetical protein [Gemmatimonadaceae bacterium]